MVSATAFHVNGRTVRTRVTAPATAGGAGRTHSLPGPAARATARRLTGKLRLHLDVNPVDRTQAEELDRLLALGAQPASIGQSGDEPWHALQDPEGNEFCLLRRQLPEL